MKLFMQFIIQSTSNDFEFKKLLFLVIKFKTLTVSYTQKGSILS